MNRLKYSIKQILKKFSLPILWGGWLWFSIAASMLLLSGDEFNLYKSILLASISFVMAVFVIFTVRSSTRRKQIVGMGASYLLILFTCAEIYSILYIRNPNGFIFSESILGERAIQTYEENIDKLININEKLYELSILYSEPETLFGAVEDGLISLKGRTPGRIFGETFKVRAGRVYNAFSLPTDFMSISNGDMICQYGGKGGFDKENRIISRFINSKSGRDAQLALGDLISLLKEKRSNIKSTLKSGIISNHKWRRIDFVYFSAVTMTTLGYGDIIPNSNIVRMIVGGIRDRQIILDITMKHDGTSFLTIRE